MTSTDRPFIWGFFAGLGFITASLLVGLLLFAISLLTIGNVFAPPPRSPRPPLPVSANPPPQAPQGTSQSPKPPINVRVRTGTAGRVDQ